MTGIDIHSRVVGPDEFERISKPFSKPPSPTPDRICTTCRKTEDDLPNSLKACAKCHKSLYCSRNCQKKDWKSHKRGCGLQTTTAGTNNGNVPTKEKARNNKLDNIASLFGITAGDAYLHTLHEKEVYRQLIDAYRLRADDDYSWGKGEHGIYAEEGPLEDFQMFLNLAERREGILPEWWSKEKRMECERLGNTSRGWSSLNCAVEKSDIQEHYSDNLMPMTLRMLAERIYGNGLMDGM
ncbi:MAG: hypothetical protein M1834_006981 [Cirrosporium novae-zelandiae]|nr:MAG: hypothetical protein M1834_006981 [Cirrosporium novae-zelandiae]